MLSGGFQSGLSDTDVKIYFKPYQVMSICLNEEHLSVALLLPLIAMKDRDGQGMPLDMVMNSACTSVPP